jgi:hypothetical protein
VSTFRGYRRGAKAVVMLTEIRAANFAKRIADHLMMVFDLGERDPSALKRAALEGISVWPANS